MEHHTIATSRLTPVIGGSCLLALTRVGELPVAIDALQIVAIQASDNRGTGVVIDLAAVLSPPDAPALPLVERRVAHVWRDRRAIDVLLGAHVELKLIALDAMYAVPRLLRGDRGGFGPGDSVIGFVRHEDSLFLLVDVLRLASWTPVPAVAASTAPPQPGPPP